MTPFGLATRLDAKDKQTWRTLNIIEAVYNDQSINQSHSCMMHQEHTVLVFKDHVVDVVHVETLWEFKRRRGDWTPPEGGGEEAEEPNREEAEVWNRPESPGSFM